MAAWSLTILDGWSPTRARFRSAAHCARGFLGNKRRERASPFFPRRAKLAGALSSLSRAARGFWEREGAGVLLRWSVAGADRGDRGVAGRGCVRRACGGLERCVTGPGRRCRCVVRRGATEDSITLAARKTSSAARSRSTVIRSVRTLSLARRASASTSARVIPGRQPETSGGVESDRRFTTKTLLDVPSLTVPSDSTKIASSARRRSAYSRPDTAARYSVVLCPRVSPPVPRPKGKVTARIPARRWAGRTAGMGRAATRTVGARRPLGRRPSPSPRVTVMRTAASRSRFRASTRSAAPWRSSVAAGIAKCARLAARRRRCRSHRKGSPS